MTRRKEHELADASKFLAENADEIRRLAEEWVRVTSTNVPEIGRRLVACRDRLPHGHWLHWLEAEFQWSSRTARNYICVYEWAQEWAQRSGKLENFSSLVKKIDLSALVLLAQPSTLPEIREEFLQVADAGEAVKHSLVRRRLRRRSPASVPEVRPGADPRGLDAPAVQVVNPAPSAAAAADAAGEVILITAPPPAPMERVDVHRPPPWIEKIDRELLFRWLCWDEERGQWFKARFSSWPADTGGGGSKH